MSDTSTIEETERYAVPGAAAPDRRRSVSSDGVRLAVVEGLWTVRQEPRAAAALWLQVLAGTAPRTGRSRTR